MANISKIKNIHNQKIAKIGEILAKQYLLRKNFTILQVNVKFREGEIDIIAKKSRKLVFVEVKTRTNQSFSYQAALTYQKRKRMFGAISKYLQRNNYRGSWQADLISLEIIGRLAKLRHYQSIEL